ncbi:hypothetical protein [Flavilitoribacter nigricans]|nr:hypothetical protein [Flavilitoribacter nigricans]
MKKVQQILTAIGILVLISACVSYPDEVFDKLTNRQKTEDNCEGCGDCDINDSLRDKCKNKCFFYNPKILRLVPPEAANPLCNLNLLVQQTIRKPNPEPCNPRVCAFRITHPHSLFPDTLTYGMAVFDKSGKILFESRNVRPNGNTLEFNFIPRQDISAKKLKRVLSSSTISFETFYQNQRLSYFTVPNVSSNNAILK